MDPIKKTYLQACFNLARAGAVFVLAGVSAVGVWQGVANARDERKYSDVFTNAANCRSKLAKAKSCTVEEQQSMAIREVLAQRRLAAEEKILIPAFVASLL